jgi:outer membrane lipoprotein-sorting protein
MVTLVTLVTLVVSAPVPAGDARAAEPLSADEIVRRMDDNMTFKSRVSDASLTIHAPGSDPEVKKLKIWARGAADGYAEFVSPPRDKGVKYLKLDQNLYMFLPRTEKVVKVSGHLLRQGLMDSDFSYEDMMESRVLLADYEPRLVGEEVIDGTPCFVLDLTARRPGLTYARRKLWVARETWVPLRVERYAQGGLLLKVMTTSDVRRFGARHYPARMTMEDRLKKGTRTEFALDNVVFDVDLPPSLFSRRQLMKGD